MRNCIYCGTDKEDSEFSDEHIWPDALGGDHLPDFWRTDQVCRSCNSASGLYVDGVFIKGFAGAAERTSDAYSYIAKSEPARVVVPLDYLGYLVDVSTTTAEVAEYWVGPCGAHVVHFRPGDIEDQWSTFASGDPRLGRKVATAGRAYLSVASSDLFWVEVCLSTFKAHFKKAVHYVTNVELRPQDSPLKEPDRTDPVVAQDMTVVESIDRAAKVGKSIKTRLKIRNDAGDRFMAKLALALGYKLFGQAYLDTDYALRVREGFREADPKKRQSIAVSGAGYWKSPGLAGAERVLRWSGAWVLMLVTVSESMVLNVITPLGKTMHVVITGDRRLTASLNPSYRHGVAWITVPELGEAVGPIPLPDYLSHQLGSQPLPQLVALEAKRIDPATLPPCGE